MYQLNRSYASSMWEAGNALAQKVDKFVASSDAVNASFNGDTMKIHDTPNLLWIITNAPQVYLRLR
jgi:hypothetical protein